MLNEEKDAVCLQDFTINDTLLSDDTLALL